MSEMRASKEADQRATQEATPGPIQRTLQQGITALTGIVMGRADLSDLDVEKILGTLSSAKDKVTQKPIN
jgi:hypothetical protein